MNESRVASTLNNIPMFTACHAGVKCLQPTLSPETQARTYAETHLIRSLSGFDFLPSQVAISLIDCAEFLHSRNDGASRHPKELYIYPRTDLADRIGLPTKRSRVTNGPSLSPATLKQLARRTPLEKLASNRAIPNYYFSATAGKSRLTRHYSG